MADAPVAPPSTSAECSRCPRCERSLRREIDSSSLSPSPLGRTISSPLPSPSPPAAAPGSLFRHKSDCPSPSSIALAARGPLFPAPASDSEEVRLLKEQIAKLLAEKASQRPEAILMFRKENMVEVQFQCSCGRDHKAVAKIEP